jgi:hypothetical protein
MVYEILEKYVNAHIVEQKAIHEMASLLVSAYATTLFISIIGSHTPLQPKYELLAAIEAQLLHTLRQDLLDFVLVG